MMSANVQRLPTAALPETSIPAPIVSLPKRARPARSWGKTAVQIASNVVPPLVVLSLILVLLGCRILFEHTLGA